MAGVKVDDQPLEVALSRLMAPDREVRRQTAEQVTAALEPGLRTRAFIVNTLALDKAVEMAQQAQQDKRAGQMNFGSAGVGFGIAMLLQALRMRLPWWPFHPLGYAVTSSWEINLVWMPLFIAWVLKVVILRYSGRRLYEYLLPFFTGLIVGESLFGVLNAGLIVATSNDAPKARAPPNSGAVGRPSYLESRRAMREHMPELVPTYERLRERIAHVQVAGLDQSVHGHVRNAHQARYLAYGQ